MAQHRKFGITLLILSISMFVTLQFDGSHSAAQMDPTLQHATVDAMIAEMFAATQTAQSGERLPTATITSTHTAVPVPIYVPYVIRVPSREDIDLEKLQSVVLEAVDGYLASLPATQTDRLETPVPHLSPSISQIKRYEYAVIHICDLASSADIIFGGLNGARPVSYLSFETAAPVSDAVVDALSRTSFESWNDFLDLLNIVGEDGWELAATLMPFSGDPEHECQPFAYLKREVGSLN